MRGGVPLVVGTGYFPQASDLQGHSRANSELLDFVRGFRAQGALVVFGGDLNAHMGANGDTMPTDSAGRMLLESEELMDMVVVNTMGGVCIGGPTRVQVRADGTQRSTVD